MEDGARVVYYRSFNCIVPRSFHGIYEKFRTLYVVWTKYNGRTGVLGRNSCFLSQLAIVASSFSHHNGRGSREVDHAFNAVRLSS
jgi:hypothetical protein